MFVKNLHLSKFFTISISLLFIVTFFFILYLIFRKFFLVRFINALEATFLEIIEGDSFKNKPENFDKEDKIERNKEKEKEKSKKIDIELEVISKTLNSKNKINPKIVGLNFKILGPFTQRIVFNFLKNIKNVNPKEVNEKGYFQAQELSRSDSKKRQSGTSRNL